VYDMTWTRHENGAGATPTCGRRRRRRADQLRSAAAASAKCRRRRRGGGGAQLCYTPTTTLLHSVAGTNFKVGEAPEFFWRVPPLFWL